MNLTRKLAAAGAAITLAVTGSLLTTDVAHADESNGKCRGNTHRPVKNRNISGNTIYYREVRNGPTKAFPAYSYLATPIAEVYVPEGGARKIQFSDRVDGCRITWDTSGWKSAGDSQRGFAPDNGSWDFYVPPPS